MLARREDLRPNPGEDLLREDLDERGFYGDVPDRPRLRASRSDRVPHVVIGDNSYRFFTQKKRPRHRVVARVVPAKRRTKRLVVMFHCYAAPWPRMMAKLFGLDGIEDADVAYPIMNHHQRGCYPLWPGSGLTSANSACMVENLRSAVVGARTLVRGLVAEGGYEHVTVIGFSIGGQLALHVANTEPVNRVLLYCPVVSMARTARELGVMRFVYPGVSRIGRWFHPLYDEALLSVADPLRHSLRVPEDAVDVLLHKHDALTPPHQIEPIRDKYPRVGWHELGGAHVVPVGWKYIKELVRRVV